MFRISLLRFIGAACLALSLFAPTFAHAASATSVVEDFQKTLLSVMKDADQLGYDGRYQRLAPVVKNSHDMPGITRVATGRNWDQMSEEQKTRLVDLFTRLSIATYAARFNAYAGETFKTVGEEKLANGDRLVRTLFADSTGDTIPFDYVLREQDGKWRIVNITVQGVSDLAIRRSEYASIIRKDGVDGLMKKLQDKIGEYQGPAAVEN